MYKRDIYLDIDDNLNNYIKSVELDSDSRVWHFHLTVDYEPLDLTGKSVQFRAEKPDKTNVLNDCKIVDAENGIVEVELTRQVNAVPGHVKCLLKIIGDEDFVLKTKTFVVDVSKTLPDDAVVSSDEFGVLEAALGKVQDIDNRFAQTNAQLSSIVKNHLNISVKDHGVVGDGITDDTNAIQKLFSEIETPCTIYFPSGVYLVSDELLLPKVSTTICGDGREVTIIKATGDRFRSIFHRPLGNTATYCSFEKIKFDCNKVAEHGFYFNQAKGDIINECAFWNHTYSALTFKNETGVSESIAYGIVISKCYIRGVLGELNGNEASETMPMYNMYFGKGCTDNIVFETTSINARYHLEHYGGNHIINMSHFFDYPNPQYDSEIFINCKGDSYIVNNYFDNAKLAIKVDTAKQQIQNNRFFWAKFDFNRDNYGGIKLNIPYGEENTMISNNYFSCSHTGQSSKVGFDIVDVMKKKVNGISILGNVSQGIINPYNETVRFYDEMEVGRRNGIDICGTPTRDLEHSFSKVIEGERKKRWTLKVDNKDESLYESASSMVVAGYDNADTETTYMSFNRNKSVDFSVPTTFTKNLTSLNGISSKDSINIYNNNGSIKVALWSGGSGYIALNNKELISLEDVVRIKGGLRVDFDSRHLVFTQDGIAPSISAMNLGTRTNPFGTIYLQNPPIVNVAEYDMSGFAARPTDEVDMMELIVELSNKICELEEKIGTIG